MSDRVDSLRNSIQDAISRGNYISESPTSKLSKYASRIPKIKESLSLAESAVVPEVATKTASKLIPIAGVIASLADPSDVHTDKSIEDPSSVEYQQEMNNKRLAKVLMNRRNK